jgi:serine/threonine protein kinase
MEEGVGRGSVVAGFRVVRPLPRGSLGEVYEATQDSLERTVALRLLDAERLEGPEDEARFRTQQRIAAAFHHPNAVPTYEAGDWGSGSFVVSRFIRGEPLSIRLERGSIGTQAARRIVDQIESALDAAHRAGLVHGAVSAANVLVDSVEDGHLADLGLGRPGSVEQDREDLAALRERVEAGGAGKGRARWLRVGAALLLCMAAVAVGVLLLLGDDDDPAGPEDEPAPVVAEGSVPLGGNLAPGSADALGCAVRPGPNTRLCTLVHDPATAGGVAVRSGVITRWFVRGSVGEMALQVIGFRRGKPFLRGFTQSEQPGDVGVHAFEANLRIERGDTIGLLVSPGASVGLRSAVEDASVERWEGTPPLSPRRVGARDFAGEMLLRADIVPGVRPDLGELTGPRAERAPEGTVIGRGTVETSTLGTLDIAVVRVSGGIAIDLLDGPLRLTRLPVPDAEPGGKLSGIDPDCGFDQGFCLRWTNGDDASQVFHAYRVDGDELVPIG